MEELKTIVAKNMTELRHKNRLTQAEGAASLHYSDKAVSKWERGESLPDIGVLKEIADLYQVTVDYLLSPEHSSVSEPTLPGKHKRKNLSLITILAVLLVWLIATLTFVILRLAVPPYPSWFAFVLAVPVSLIVWLVLNSLWFNRRWNFLIISLLLWSLLALLFLIFLPFEKNLWLIYTIGIPAQAIIIVWSRIKRKHP